MKNLRLLIAATMLCVFNYSNAQFCGADSYTMIDTSLLYVPKTGHQPFDDALESALKKYWKVTRFKIVPLKEYQAMHKDNESVKTKPKAIESDNAAKERMAKDQKAMKYSLFDFGQGGIGFGKTHGAGTHSERDEYLPSVHNLENEQDLTKKLSPKGMYKIGNLLYKLDYMVKGANDAVAYALENKIETEWNVRYGVIGHVFNSKAAQIKEKTLLINSQAQSPFGATVYKESVFAEKYPFPYKFVPAEEFYKVLASDSKEYFCLMTLPGGLSFIMVYEPATRSNLYLEYAPRKGGFEKFKEENAEELVKRIKGVKMPIKRLIPADR